MQFYDKIKNTKASSMYLNIHSLGVSILLKIKNQLDEYVKKYETKDFIKNDPVQFIHRYSNKEDKEVIGFIASSFSYGNREVFIRKLDFIFGLMGKSPLEYIKAGDFGNIKNCSYRFSKDIDLIEMFRILNILYCEGESLESLFKYSYNTKKDVWEMFQGVVDYFYSRVKMSVTKGFYHLLPNPNKKSALKRMNMMLRWFVRDGVVDVGIWKFISKSELFIPLDTHVAKISRELGFLKREGNGKESVIEITKVLREFDKNDPIKYDFALFGYGVNNKK